MGPAFAVGHAVRTDVRYSRDMFEHPSPEIVAEKQTCTISQLALQQSTLASEAALIANSSPLKSTGQGPGGAWGYFEQGLVIGAVVYLLPVAVGSIAVAVYGGLWAYRNLVSK